MLEYCNSLGERMWASQFELGILKVRKSGDDVCAHTRTITRTARHAEKKYEEPHPKMRRQANVRLSVQCFALSVSARVSLCLSVYACANTTVCLTDSRV